MYSICTSGCGMRAVLVWAGAWGFEEKEAGLVISETT
jgi:hypothetical protein